MPSYQRLQQYAIAISVASILYNGAEGGISIGFGSESSSRSLVFFGVQSGIEVVSAAIVVWRFRRIARPGEEAAAIISDADLRVEKAGTWGIGVLLAILAVATEVTAIVGLALHLEPDSSNASLIISASALVIMVLIWLPKRYLARALNSSTMMGEATCSLSCIQITIVLFVGALVFRLWKGGWWVDSATSLVLGIMFGHEAWKMISWVRDPAFNGGCCGDCKQPRLEVDAELGEQYRDICDCCLEKEDCKMASACKCDAGSDESLPCCKPVDHEGTKCCTHDVIQGARPLAHVPAPASCQDKCCGGNATAEGCADAKPTSTSTPNVAGSKGGEPSNAAQTSGTSRAPSCDDGCCTVGTDEPEPAGSCCGDKQSIKSARTGEGSCACCKT